MNIDILGISQLKCTGMRSGQEEVPSVGAGLGWADSLQKSPALRWAAALLGVWGAFDPQGRGPGWRCLNIGTLGPSFK